MAGFFGLFDFTKPGKGIDPDEPEKKPFFKFWELLWRKLGRLFVLNLMYFICILPLVIYGYVSLYSYLGDIIYPTDAEGPASLILAAFSFVVDIPGGVNIALLCLSLFIYGPATCGFTYILRNFTREEHAWYSDFWQKSLANWKQGLFFGFLDFIVVIFLFMNLTLTSALPPGEDAFTSFLALSRYVTILLFIFYLFMRQTAYLQVVTVALPSRLILKNAAILGVIGLPRHILSTIITLVAMFCFTMLHGFVEFLTVPLFAFSFCGFTSVFINYPLLKKYIIDPAMAREAAGENEEAEEL